MDNIYLDSAATTQMREEVIGKIHEVMKNTFGNPSSTHAYGRSSKAILENARKTIAGYLKVQASEIIFTSGGTEADNLILNSAVRDLGITKIITSPIEHHAVLHTVEQLKNRYPIAVNYVHLLENGEIDTDHLETLLKESTGRTLVSLMHINNEIGNILDLKAVAELCKKYEALFHSDTVQSVGHYALDFSEIPIDFAAASAHKFHGPKGAGFAFVRKESGLKPLIFGGEQERGQRAGTESVHNIAGMEEALKISLQKLAEEKADVQQLKKKFIETLKNEIPGIKFNGNSADLATSTYTLVNVNLPITAEKATMLLFQLDLNGIACSKGSACQSGSDKGSHVLEAILDEKDLKKPSIRFSFSSFNTEAELNRVVEVLKKFMAD